MNTFTPQFRKAVESVAEEIGLINATNSRHENNGTIAYIDPVVSSTSCVVTYTLHTNGYLRRNFRYSNRHGLNPRRDCYQLNPIKRTNLGTERIMMSPLEQLGKLTTSVISYRNGN